MFEVAYGTHRIPVQVDFDGYRTLRISVRPDGVVSVRAPEGTPEEHVQERAQAKAAWIFRQLEHFRLLRQVAGPREYVSGETHRYLGRSYRLRVREGDRNEVRLAGRFFEISTANAPRRAKVRELMDAWYLRRAREVFERVLHELCLRHAGLGLTAPPRMIVRAMASRWGSCSRSGTITLNRHLVRAPMGCVQYVIAHELCHLCHYGHTPGFYDLLATIMPDWCEQRAKLAQEPLWGDDGSTSATQDRV